MRNATKKRNDVLQKGVKMKKFFCLTLFFIMLVFSSGIQGCANNGNYTDSPSLTEEPLNTLIANATATPAPIATPNIDAQNKITADPEINPETNTPTPTPDAELPLSYCMVDENGLPVRFMMPTELYGYSEEECEQWFADACFVGDSIVLGWKNYNTMMIEDANSTFFGNTRFFCEGSYGYGHALEPVTEDSVHPRYAGEKHSIEEALVLMNVKKVFICFGVNDISIYGVDGTIDNCRELINRILTTVNSGDLKVYIMSAMYMYEGSEREKLNNKNLLALNCGLAEVCNENGLTFINLASHLIDEDGFVPDEYSSDKYVHQTYAAYQVWADVLRAVAARELNGVQHPIFVGNN